MNCTNCGGGLEPVGNRNYFRCLYCATFHFPEGTDDGLAVVGGEATFPCPVCEQLLTLGSVEGEDVCYCRTCRGILADNATFGAIVRRKRSRQAGQEYVPVPFAAEELTRRVTCPGCRQPMDTHPYHAGGNAVIDTCHRCRLVWLDTGELAVLGKYPDRVGVPGFATAQADGEDEDKLEEEGDNALGFHIRLF